jgi:hypothetical protein
MKFHLIFIVASIAIAWLSAYLGAVDLFWLRMLAVLFGVFGFVFVFMLTDAVGDGTRSVGIDFIAIAIALMIVWV